ncbi:hypothetical protein KUL25_18110 [Rhodobacteraceae bacterium N5(2021)]|uniref:Uncharacterized protein n=1 Tax=Gymnodinialimonas phycosphaerae TaxID=2841589 RepID=A0A975TTH2_9RHOB|nr:hypothetical protein [Gymnodinialimonas phycosphaerae]MBY4894678.1 hypothetical protein [Gymnodinialimonas phycosphaerae]
MLVLLGAAAGLALGEAFSDDGTDTSGDTPVGDEDTGEIVRVDTALGFIGSDEADVFTFDPEARGAVVTSIDAGAGDDIIDLASLFGDPALVGSDVQGGAGDDLIEVQGDLPTQDVQIIVSATGLTWGDVTFSDQAPATLTVA